MCVIHRISRTQLAFSEFSPAPHDLGIAQLNFIHAPETRMLIRPQLMINQLAACGVAVSAGIDQPISQCPTLASTITASITTQIGNSNMTRGIRQRITNTSKQPPRLGDCLLSTANINSMMRNSSML